MLCDSSADGLQVEQYLRGLDVVLPFSPVFGALLPGTGSQLLYASPPLFKVIEEDSGHPDDSDDDDGWMTAGGGVGLAITGDTVIEAIASPGCVPLGPIVEVTSTGGYSNTIAELDGVPAAKAMQVLHGARLVPHQKVLYRMLCLCLCLYLSVSQCVCVSVYL